MPASNLAELRHSRAGSLQNGQTNGIMGPMPGANRFDGPRSPPNTSHVPCKFFRQGACQAGNACPFSHDIGAAAENVCKYFAKGNCKFGPKCANIHVLPDGRRINYHKGNFTIGGAAPIPLGNRVNPTTYHQSSNSALTNSFMRADNAPPYTATGAYPVPSDERYGHHLGRQPSLESGLPTIDTTYSSNPASAYGSPRDDDIASRFGLGLSPGGGKGLSVLDAPLPASFDSNGISHAARYGPWPASVPSKFGLESPSPSLNAAKDGRTSETLKLLHTSAFGSSEHLSPSALPVLDGGSTVGSSPPTQSGGVGLGGSGSDEYFGKQPRAMHSASLRYAKPRVMSSSAPKFDRDWEPEFLFEEDYVPDALANEVLTPAEKARRGSLRLPDGASGNGGGIDNGGMVTTTKFGSPVTAASPSRWGPLFQRQREEELESSGIGVGLSTGKAMKHAAASAFGHVGSPLRQSSLAIEDEMNGGGVGTVLSNGRPSAAPATSGSRSGSGTGSESLSVLTQQLQRTRIGDDSPGGSSPRLHPHMARNSTGGSLGTVAGAIGKERDRERQLERHVSSGSIGSSVAGRFTTPIDEEDPAFVFSMEEEDEAVSRARKRVSGGPLGGLGGGWSYAGVVAGRGNGPSTGSLAGGKARDGTTSGNGIVDGVGGR